MEASYGSAGRKWDNVCWNLTPGRIGYCDLLWMWNFPELGRNLSWAGNGYSYLSHFDGYQKPSYVNTCADLGYRKRMLCGQSNWLLSGILSLKWRYDISVILRLPFSRQSDFLFLIDAMVLKLQKMKETYNSGQMWHWIYWRARGKQECTKIFEQRRLDYIRSWNRKNISNLLANVRPEIFWSGRKHSGF